MKDVRLERQIVRSLSAAAGLLLCIGAAGAADREHGAHMHGVSQLNIAVEGKTIEMELVSPASDIVGFEHAAKTDAEKKAVEQASETLSKGLTVFSFPADGKCAVEEVDVRSTLEATRETHHGGHAHDEKAPGHAPETHAEFHVHYHFHCENPAAVTYLDVKLFDHFKTMREIEVQALTTQGQRAQELTPGAARLKL
jgi:hypothetical protein